MIIIDHFKCDVCGDSYKGRFKFTRKGKVECVNCDAKEKVTDIHWEQMQNDGDMDKKLLRSTVQGMLFDDVERIYRAESEDKEDYVKRFFDDDGEFNMKMLYFQQNPIDMVMEGQKLAYSALRYLEGNDTDFKDHAQRLVDVYKEFRERKLSDADVIKTWDIYFSSTTMDMLGRDDAWE